MTNQNNSKGLLRILHLEDSPLDAELIREQLIDGGFCLEVDQAKTEEQFTAFLKSGHYDLILADYHLPAFEGEEALRLAKKHAPGVPFICVSGAIGEIKAVELLKNGATDYVSKGMLDKLPLAIVRALDEAWERKERRLATESLQFEQNRAQHYLDTVETIIIALDTEGIIEGINRKGCEILGYSEDDLIGKNWFSTCLPQPEGEDKIHPYFLKLISREGADQNYMENQVVTRSGELRNIAWHNSLSFDSSGEVIGMLCSGDDITDRKVLEEKLLQAKKVEAVGRLAGGVAHDFNNMLSVIIGHSEMALMRIEPAHPLYSSLTEIRKAAERSADLTKQLLAFARKQTVSPRLLDLNASISGMFNMLQRLIGENIHLIWKPGSRVWPVMMDNSQLDQIMANLCVNARDAIADVGEIIIESENCSVDKNYCKTHPYATPGDYVKIIISDDGKGMEKETLSHIFEPFFTTKEVGEGTGLGLATIYGIVRQNQGFINVYSESGNGTTFTIYLPRYAGSDKTAEEERNTAAAPRGSETILLVEDETAILTMTTLILSELGYTILKAGTPEEAIRRARESDHAIDLLVTDVIMPKMNGKDLANYLLPLHPQMRTLFMSGYTADIIAHHGVLDDGVHFIQKPFQINVLAAKLREVLGHG